MQSTITEALAGLKRIDARIEAKRKLIREAAVRPEIMVDPHAKTGGSAETIKATLQSIADLGRRFMAIRAAVAASNAARDLTINGKTRKIGDWLVWRREVVGKQKTILMELLGSVQQLRRAGGQFRDPQGNNPVNAVVNVDEAQLQKELTVIEDTLGVLDGLLSVANATTTIEIPDEVE